MEEEVTQCTAYGCIFEGLAEGGLCAAHAWAIKYVAGNVRSARLDRGMSQYQLAFKAGVSQKSVSRIEQGSTPLLETLVSVLSTLDLRLEVVRIDDEVAFGKAWGDDFPSTIELMSQNPDYPARG